MTEIRYRAYTGSPVERNGAFAFAYRRAGIPVATGDEHLGGDLIYRHDSCVIRC